MGRNGHQIQLFLSQKSLEAQIGSWWEDANRECCDDGLLPYVVFICIGHCLEQVAWQYGCLYLCFRLYLFIRVLESPLSKAGNVSNTAPTPGT